MSAPLNIAILGATGRMGRRLIQGVQEAPQRWRLTGALVAPGSPVVGADAGEQAGVGHLGVALTDDCDAAVAGAAVAVDFTLPAATPAVLAACVQARMPLVMGTTGLDHSLQARLDEAAAILPLVYARNFSVGIALLEALTRRAAEVLGEDYDAEVHEAHHRHKVDAPSGTALALGEAVAAGRGRRFAEIADYARAHGGAPRAPGSLGFSVVRAGGIVGEHTVLLAADEERLELTHRALDRSAFARGALRAAAWVAGRAPGRYDLQDVLGLSLAPPA